MTTNDEINWEINEPIISRYGIQTWKNGKSPEHLVDVRHTGVSLNHMLNETRDNERARIVERLKVLIKERKPNDKYGRQLIERIIEEIEESD